MSERAITWQRVSTDTQETVNQSADIAGHVERNGYEVIHAYAVEGMSAYHGRQQDALDDMLSRIRREAVTVVVVWHSDRLERRGAHELLDLLRLIRDAGARVESVKEPELGAASMAGQLLTFLGGFMAHAESEHKSDRIKAKQALLRSRGSWASGKSPFGLDIVALADGRKTLEPNGDAETVERIFEMTAEGMSYGAVARALKAEGIPAPGGNADWHEAVIGQIVRNPNFRGLVLYQGKPYMTVTPIVSSDLWLRANADIKTRATSKGYARRGSGRPSPAFLKPVCGRCQSPMYRYGVSYRCNGKPGARRCGNGAKLDANTIKVETLDKEVLADFLADDEPEISETVVQEATDYAEQIAAVELAIGDLSPREPGYREAHAALMTELDRLIALPVQPEIRQATRTGRQAGDVFEQMTGDERRAHVRQWKLTVWPAGSDNQNALVAALKGRRWALTRA